MSDDSSTLPPPPPPPPLPSTQVKSARTNLQEIRNSDLVNRFLAATPPYLYSPPVGPPNFFFSEMLRSLVQARTNEQNSRLVSNQIRRARKRLWVQNRCMFDTTTATSAPSSVTKECNETYSHQIDRTTISSEKPIELTKKILPNMMVAMSSTQKLEHRNALTPEHTNQDHTSDENTKLMSEPPRKQARNISPNETISNEPSASTELVLPPPPPMWYPPLYPPYGIDPLHFFIDLRVSDHIYDRKKENISPATTNILDNNNTTSAMNLENNQIGKHRHGSAFSVPPRRDKSPLALNLTASTISNDKSIMIDYSNNNNDSDDKTIITKNTNYVLQNLPRIYTTLTTQSGDDRQSLLSEDAESKSDSDLQEIEVRENERVLDDLSDDVVIVDQDFDDTERKCSNRSNYKLERN